MDTPIFDYPERNSQAEGAEGPVGWRKLVEGFPWFEGDGRYPLPAYSEFMPPPRLGRTPYGEIDPALFSEEDPYGWYVSEREEEHELKPGLLNITRQVMTHLLKLGRGLPEPTISGHNGLNLLNNTYWPPELAAQAGKLSHERYVSFLPLALSRTQDDKGRILWTFFGGSEQGPECVFWKGFFTAPGREMPEEEGLAFFVRLLSNAYGEEIQQPSQLRAAGFYILPSQPGQHRAALESQSLPSWSAPFLIDESSSFENVRYLLTFRPFSCLPVPVRAAYLAGRLNLLPFPGSLVSWGMPTYLHLQEQLPRAIQVPLLRLVARRGGPGGVRVPQHGWIYEPRLDSPAAEFHHELLVPTHIRTSRWDRIHRFEDELSVNSRLEKILKVLFSTDLDILGLYDKPMARNCQIWTRDFDLLLDGPRASEKEIHRAEAALDEGGLFAYRFLFPAMQVGLYEVYWHRLVVTYLSPRSEEIELLPDSPLGYITAYLQGSNDWLHPIELWPRLFRRPIYLSALLDFETPHDHYAHQTELNILSLISTWQMMRQRPLARSFARSLIRISKEESLEEWIESLSVHAREATTARQAQEAITTLLEPAGQSTKLPEAITYADSASRSFEVAYWNDIRFLAQGDFQNKDNADCVDDPPTLSQLSHHHRDLDRLANYLIKRHREAIHAVAMDGKALCGDLPFRWRTDFEYPLFGGWKSNQAGDSYERDLLVMIPGKDRTHPIILADHYDTAYMEDLYEKSRGGSGARKSAAGADDNHSATATLLQAAPIYLKLAREGRLERDIWLLHQTGEEFPADCLGARQFCQALVQKTLKLRLEENEWVDLSEIRPAGVFVMDMIAHNRETDQDIFQISPGRSSQSLYLARQAHLANLIWNAGTYQWNSGSERRGCGRGKRSPDGIQIPEMADHLRLFGEVRTRYDPASSLYNTDGQIFSDIGAPVVLFMENYDIYRSGYHDTKDTMENIDLDFGAALAAIAIETVARMATLEELPEG